jgi:dihydroneopterin aldolase
MSHTFTGDRILLTDLGFYGYHGLHSEENSLGQRFFIDLQCGVDLTRPAQTDTIGATVSYADIYDVVKTAFEEKRMHLIEAVGQNIVDSLFAAFSDITWIIIRVRKPEAPIAMVRGEAAIELHRLRPA